MRIKSTHVYKDKEKNIKLKFKPQLSASAMKENKSVSTARFYLALRTQKTTSSLKFEDELRKKQKFCLIM